MFGRRTTSPLLETTETDPGDGTGEEFAPFEPLWSPDKMAAKRSVESLLLERGQITEAHLAQARQVALQTPGKSLAQILLTMNAASEAQILSALAQTLALPFETPERSAVDLQAFELLPVDYIRKNAVIPL